MKRLDFNVNSLIYLQEVTMIRIIFISPLLGSCSIKKNRNKHKIE